MRDCRTRCGRQRRRGTVRFDDGPVTVVADLPKRVEWDQSRLAELADRIRAGGENPGDYVEVSFKVAERAHAAWPERIRTVFETARTGRQTFKLILNPDHEAATRRINS